LGLGGSHGLRHPVRGWEASLRLSIRLSQDSPGSHGLRHSAQKGAGRLLCVLTSSSGSGTQEGAGRLGFRHPVMGWPTSLSDLARLPEADHHHRTCAIHYCAPLRTGPAETMRAHALPPSSSRLWWRFGLWLKTFSRMGAHTATPGPNCQPFWT
jgi:hypothetical protein